ncbi:MAG: hypothetical protein ACRD0N_04750 [Acidimicrobiales bacterium]
MPDLLPARQRAGRFAPFGPRHTRYIYDDEGLPLQQVTPDGVSADLHHDQLGSLRLLTHGGQQLHRHLRRLRSERPPPPGDVTTPFGFAGEHTQHLEPLARPRT